MKCLIKNVQDTIQNYYAYEELRKFKPAREKTTVVDI